MKNPINAQILSHADADIITNRVLAYKITKDKNNIFSFHYDISNENVTYSVKHNDEIIYSGTLDETLEKFEMILHPEQIYGRYKVLKNFIVEHLVLAHFHIPQLGKHKFLERHTDYIGSTFLVKNSGTILLSTKNPDEAVMFYNHLYPESKF